MSLKSRRLKALMESYKTLFQCGTINHQTTIKRSAELLVISPAPSFFLTPMTIDIYLYYYENSIIPPSQTAQILYYDLHQTYLRLRSEHPTATRKELVELLATLPAPRYYITPETAARLLFFQ